LMISISRVRGIVGESLTPELVLKFSQAFGSICGGGKIVVGRDSRVSGEMLKLGVLSGLLSMGCEVIDLDVCPTPTTEIMVKELHADGGIIITASHNPAEWNALKFLNQQGIFLNESENKKLLKIFDENDYQPVAWDKVGSIRQRHDSVEVHLKKILNLDYIDVEKIKKKRFKVVLDCVNGAAGVISPLLLESLGCEVTLLNGAPTGHFAHNPEPRPENLQEISETVKKVGADIGFVNDPDVDRLAIVAETGEPIGEEWTLALCIKYVLGRMAGPIAVNLSSSRMIDDVAEYFKVPCFRTKVGEINVTQCMIEKKCVIGGEGNGGVILPAVHYGRDAVTAMALILQSMAHTDNSITQLRAGIPAYEIVKSKIEVKKNNIEKMMVKLAKSFKGEEIDSQDGIKVNFKDAWIHIRKSNTEPIIRVISEAKSKEKATQLCDDIKVRVKSLG